MARKRASMREGPLAELFRATEAAQRTQGDTAESPQPKDAAPGPEPTSRARIPDSIAAKSANRLASGRDQTPMNRSYASAATSKAMV